jgi:hypothetical protein
MTKSAKLREERVSVRFANTLHEAVKVKRQQELKATGEIPSKEKSSKNERPNVKFMKEEHEGILNSINQKLNYLRNPRNNPKAVKKC